MNSSRNNLLLYALVVTCFEVSGMTCGNCVAKIKSHFDAAPGVNRTQVSLNDGEVRLHTTRALTARQTKDVLAQFARLKYPAKSIPCTSSL